MYATDATIGIPPARSFRYHSHSVIAPSAAVEIGSAGPASCSPTLAAHQEQDEQDHQHQHDEPASDEHGVSSQAGRSAGCACGGR